MRIYVENYDGYVFKIDCELSDTIESVKAKVHEDLGPPQDEQALTFNETELKDGCTLSDYNIKNEDTLKSTPNYPVRGGIKFVSMDS